MAPSAIHLRFDPDKRRVTGTTENVARLSLAIPGDALAVELDGGPALQLKHSGEGSAFLLLREGKEWKAAAGVPADSKTPGRCGPFKDAFRNRMMFVYGTKGTPEENAWS